MEQFQIEASSRIDYLATAAEYIYDDKKDKMIDKIFYDEPLYDSIFVNDSLIYIAPPKEYYDIMNQERKNKNKVFRKK